MRKLLNTLYITNEKAYLMLDGENIVCKLEDDEKFRIPFDNVESIVCFSYIGCSPALMGKCAEKLIPLIFLSPHGKFLAKVSGETRGNVFLRVSQIEKFNNNVLLAQNSVAAKLHNNISLIKKHINNYPSLKNDLEIKKVTERLKYSIDEVYKCDSLESLLGLEGTCAKEFFSVFDKFINNKNFSFHHREKRPPLDPVNAVLSFLYTIYTNEFSAALEVVGLDSYIGYYHALRSGRSSLACDLMEEARCNVERATLTLFNLKILKLNDFEEHVSGAVFLNDVGRKKVLTYWQEKKREKILHPYLNEKIQFGLLPYVQSNLLAKYVRGDILEYPNYLLR